MDDELKVLRDRVCEIERAYIHFMAELNDDWASQGLGDNVSQALNALGDKIDEARAI